MEGARGFLASPLVAIQRMVDGAAGGLKVLPRSGTRGIGIVGPGPTGFAGSMIIDINRAVDIAPLRSALQEHPDVDLAVPLSDHLNEQVVAPTYPGLRPDALQGGEVAVKEFRRHTWL